MGERKGRVQRETLTYVCWPRVGAERLIKQGGMEELRVEAVVR